MDAIAELLKFTKHDVVEDILEAIFKRLPGWLQAVIMLSILAGCLYLLSPIIMLFVNAA